MNSFMIDSVAEEGEVAAQRVVGEDAGEGLGEADGGGHRGGAALQEAEADGLAEDVRVERHNQSAAVYETGP